MKLAQWSFLISAIVWRTCHSANIVVYMPLPFYSHQTSFKPLWMELAKKGHKITLIQSDVIVEGNQNITHINLNGTYDILAKYKLFDRLGEGQSLIKIILTGIECFTEALEYQMAHPEVQELLKGNTKVDLFFTEFLMTFGFYLGKKFNAPMIGLVSMDATIYGHVTAGNPTHPVIYPDRDVGFSPPMTFKERLISCLYWFAFIAVTELVLNPLQHAVIKTTLGEAEPLEDVVKNMSLLFINSNPLFSAVRPLGPKTINVGGGIHLLEPRPLPQDLQDYLDNAENGVIYFSLGSSIAGKQLPNATKSIIADTFSRLPYNVLWKFDELVAEGLDNVKVAKWVPQQDILRHENIKLFITQGGLQSMEEAIFSHVPMIALPFYGDQHNNAHIMEERGFGLTLDHTKLDVKTFESAILEVINDPRYRERTKELADLVMDQPMTGLAKAVWWTEYVLRHGQADHFRNPSVDIPWYQFLFLDVISFLLLTTLVIIYALVKISRLLKTSMCSLYGKLAKKEKSKTS